MDLLLNTSYKNKMGILTNPYRYFIVESNNQIHFEHKMGKYGYDNKSEIIIDFLKDLKTKNKTSHIYRNINYLLYLTESIKDRFYLLKLAKEKTLDLHLAGDVDVEDSETTDYPYVYIIIDIKHQIVLIQYDSNVFTSTSSTSNIISEILNGISKFYNFEIMLNPMLIKDHFWSTVNEFSEICDAEFVLESPNLFDGLIEIENVLKDIKRRYNNTKSTFRFTNNDGKLRLNKSNEELQSTIDYIGNGGGKWKLTVIEGGKKEPKESKEHIQKIVLDDELETDFKENEDKIIRYLNSVEDVMKNEKEDN